MAAWHELTSVLTQLRDQDPCPLRSYPDPAAELSNVGGPPFEITLKAWATDAAAELHRHFGADVVLTVGALGFPGGTLRRAASPPAPVAPLIGPDQANVEWAAPPVRVRSGHEASPDIVITNTGAETINASGKLIAAVVDPLTGEVVGGYTGAVTLELRITMVPPGASATVPVLLGTDSLRPELGYAVPPGEWASQVAVGVAGRPGRTPPLPLTVIG
jgi:hypothetical protein